MTLGDKLRKIRESRHLVIKDIALELEIAPSTYHSWENNCTHPTARHFAKLSQVLGISVTDLVEPDWELKVSQPAVDDGEVRKTVMEGNAFRMFDILFENQRNLQLLLEAEVKGLRKEVEQLKTENEKLRKN